jgi:hypothetical protein
MTCMYERRQRLLPLLSYGPDPCQKAPARSGWGLSIWMLGSKEQIFGRERTSPETWSERLKRHQPEGDLGEAKNKHLLPPPQSEEAEFDPLCQLRP